MQFVYPNLLYALFLLGIPILIHLFQLRKYTPVAFTNVAMLQRIEKQSRKSHSLLQWLLLLMRLLIYACIIFAFAQPFFPSDAKEAKNEEVLLYIDNYLSMDIKSGNTSLLQKVKSEVQQLENLPSQINWFTNTEVYYDQSPKQFKESIRNLSLSPIQKTPNEIQLQVQQLANRHPQKSYKLLWISDFHRFTEQELESLDKIAIEAYALKPDHTQNTSIDTLYLDSDNSKLTAEIYHNGNDSETTVSLYKEEKVLGRQKISLTDSTSHEVRFTINEGHITQGKIKIEDPNIQFDNEKYFSITPQQPIKIHAIGKGENNFLKVFESEAFQLTNLDEKANDLSGLHEANLIVLYNIERLTSQLASLIENSVESGAYILILPPETIQTESYNTLLQRLDVPQFTTKKTNQRRLSDIHYDHPVFKGVFERRIENFQNPFVNQYYGLQNNGTPILSYDSGEAFLTQAGTVYLFTASLSEGNTNFAKSPLIVPALYNIALQSQPRKQLYQLIGENATYTIPGEFNSQDILHITNEEDSFIPIQEQKQNAIWITTTDRPKLPGSYKITKEEKTLDWVSYNYPTLSKEIRYPNLIEWQSVLQTDRMQLPNREQILVEDSHTLWKWFVIFALLFLGIEILLLKYYR